MSPIMTKVVMMITCLLALAPQGITKNLDAFEEHHYLAGPGHVYNAALERRAVHVPLDTAPVSTSTTSSETASPSVSCTEVSTSAGGVAATTVETSATSTKEAAVTPKTTVVTTTVPCGQNICTVVTTVTGACSSTSQATPTGNVVATPNAPAGTPQTIVVTHTYPCEQNTCTGLSTVTKPPSPVVATSTAPAGTPETIVSTQTFSCGQGTCTQLTTVTKPPSETNQVPNGNTPTHGATTQSAPAPGVPTMLSTAGTNGQPGHPATNPGSTNGPSASTTPGVHYSDATKYSVGALKGVAAALAVLVMAEIM